MSEEGAGKSTAPDEASEHRARSARRAAYSAWGTPPRARRV